MKLRDGLPRWKSARTTWRHHYSKWYVCTRKNCPATVKRAMNWWDRYMWRTKVRKARKAAHEWFDLLWQHEPDQAERWKLRSATYDWLHIQLAPMFGPKMTFLRHRCHLKYFNKAMCGRVIVLVKERLNGKSEK